MMRSDTSPEVQKHFDALCRQLSEEERFLKGLEWIRLNRELLLAGFRARFPHFSEEQIRKELMREVYQ